MKKRRVVNFTLLALVGLLVAGRMAGRSHRSQSGDQDTAPVTNGQAENGVMQQMSHHHMGHDMANMGAHMKWTAPRPAGADDQARADALLAKLRNTLEKYKDYRVALDDGYKPFLAHLPLPEHHFTNYKYGFLAAFSFDPEKPTSLLYQRTADGWKLTGAMYTAPARWAEDKLDERVPLSVARWHAHVNICLPREHPNTSDWTRFGPGGSISTAQACEAAGGKFVPQLFGWMVHIYPFEKDPGKSVV